MERGKRTARAAERLRHLHQAAGIGARIRLRARREDVCGLAVAELARGLGLHDVVDPGRAAADVLLGGLDDLERRECGRATLARPAAALERDGGGRSPGARPSAASGWRRARGRISARNSPTSRTFAANRPRARRPSSQPSSFRCEPQPDELTTTISTSSNAAISAPRERLALLGAAGMNRERAAAALRRRDDLVAVRREDARGRSVHVGEDRPLDAPGEKPDTPARLRLAAGVTLADLAAPAPGRRDLDERTKPPREGHALAERRERERRPHPPGIREHPEEEPAERCGRRAAARTPSPRPRGSPRSAGRSERPTGTRTRTPCSRGSGRSAS